MKISNIHNQNINNVTSGKKKQNSASEVQQNESNIPSDRATISSSPQISSGSSAPPMVSLPAKVLDSEMAAGLVKYTSSQITTDSDAVSAQSGFDPARAAALLQ
ncbi:hypothetical protein KKF34_02615 [Myxococcota bacterium]|nr:hypothetical protein [Myxococcota bacterium]MBU1380946.1 hypothetical protein [Myxococcota bacterium]MBU1495755.1 hypothetical protein [Myxococcota bacterium]